MNGRALRRHQVYVAPWTAQKVRGNLVKRRRLTSQNTNNVAFTPYKLHSTFTQMTASTIEVDHETTTKLKSSRRHLRVRNTQATRVYKRAREPWFGS
ncbi:hypothetical protein MTO96_031604 [Rhipicephalus appendiculatus]